MDKADFMAAASFASVTALGRRLAGTLRPQSVVEHLLAQVGATFGPVTAAVVLLNPETRDVDSIYGDDGLGRQRTALEAGLAHPDGAVASVAGVDLIAVPLPGRRGPLGVMVVRGLPDPPIAQSQLGALAAVAGVALESARLLELADDTRRAWEETVDAVSLALCIVEPGGRVQRVNRAFAQLLGLSIGSTIGRPWVDLVPHEWGDGVRAALAVVGQGQEIPLRLGTRTFAVTAFPISGAERGRTVLLFNDHTDRQRLQDQLIQSEKLSAIGQLIAGIAHDLNNPLTSVVGFADFLAELGDVPPRIREPLLVIQQEAERAAQIVKNLLGFARKQEHRRRPTAIAPLLDATLGLLRNQLMAQRVDTELTCDPDLPELDLDPVQLQQVFVNLINNASQAVASTGQPGNVRIRARSWMQGVAVDVTDDGPGMPPGLAARAFEPFFTTKAEGEGTGLGLSISQGIVKEHGGRITLTTSEGRGATFTVELPQRSTVEPSAPAEQPSAEARPLRVLVVDDEPHILHYVRATLQEWGHTVDTASDGALALDRADRFAYDLIISDLRMPRTGGREFYEELRRRRPDLTQRVAFSTGDTIRGDTLAFLEAQGRPWLHKPFSLAELRALLRDFSRLPAA